MLGLVSNLVKRHVVDAFRLVFNCSEEVLPADLLVEVNDVGIFELFIVISLVAHLNHLFFFFIGIITTLLQINLFHFLLSTFVEGHVDYWLLLGRVHRRPSVGGLTVAHLTAGRATRRSLLAVDGVTLSVLKLFLALSSVSFDLLELRLAAGLNNLGELLVTTPERLHGLISQVDDQMVISSVGRRRVHARWILLEASEAFLSVRHANMGRGILLIVHLVVDRLLARDHVELGIDVTLDLLRLVFVRILTDVIVEHLREDQSRAKYGDG